MTAPVVTEVAPSDGPSSESLFVAVSFYVPRKNQANPPPASGVIVGRVKPMYAASQRGGHGSVYCVAQYNAPFEFDDRVNEIWFLFDVENGRHFV
ncbi:hypothetical protein K1719_034852 [Acacia pycnantha]|nr:hypothetical protein K1719_034852 [Acacia pycnantha]